MTTPDSVSKLSPRQRDCLRLVLVRMGSKEIARELGISSHTVDDHLKAASKVLGVSSRFEAARILAQHEAPPQPLGGRSVGITDSPRSVAYEVTPELGVTLEAPENSSSVQEDRAAFTVHPFSRPMPVSWMRLLTGGIERNDLSSFQRILYVMLLMVGIGIATGIAVVGMVGVAALVRGILNGTSVHITM